MTKSSLQQRTIKVEISQRIYGALAAMAVQDCRSKVGFINWLIQCEAIARGFLIPDTLPRNIPAMQEFDEAT